MKPPRPTLALALFCVSVGFVSGCGLAHFRLPGFESMGFFGGALLLSFATFAWFREDALARSYTRSRALDIGFVGLSFLILPYYLIKSRGLKRGVIAIGIAASMYLLYNFSAVVGVIFMRILKA